MRGRKPVMHSPTKLNEILIDKGINRNQLYLMIEAKYPYDAISRDALSRIVSGKRKNYSLYTLFRICSTLNVTTNEVCDIEDYENNI